MNIQDKVIVITGGAKGIGRSIALSLAGKGGKIAILDLDQAAMEEAVKLVEDAGSTARAYKCDVSDEKTVVDTFNQIASDFGAIHGLVNNAGILRDSTLIKVKDGKVVDKLSAADFDLVVNVHMKGAFLCTREAASHMVELGIDEGCIINMSSGAFRGNFGQTNYSAAKAGIVSMSRVWSKELARFNIRSMAIAPGAIDTELLRSMPPKALAGFEKIIPLGRIGNVKNIAQTVEHILENDYLSGDVIDVNGGMFL